MTLWTGTPRPSAMEAARDGVAVPIDRTATRMPAVPDGKSADASAPGMCNPPDYPMSAMYPI